MIRLCCLGHEVCELLLTGVGRTLPRAGWPSRTHISREQCQAWSRAQQAFAERMKEVSLASWREPHHPLMSAALTYTWWMTEALATCCTLALPCSPPPSRGLCSPLARSLLTDLHHFHDKLQKYTPEAPRRALS